MTALQLYSEKPIESINKNDILTFDFIGFLKFFDSQLLFVTAIIIDLSKTSDNYLLLEDIDITLDKQTISNMRIIVDHFIDDIYFTICKNIDINFTSNKVTNKLFYDLIQLYKNNKLILHFAKKSIGGIKLSIIPYDEIIDGEKIIPYEKLAMIRDENSSLNDFYEFDFDDW